MEISSVVVFPRGKRNLQKKRVLILRFMVSGAGIFAQLLQTSRQENGLKLAQFHGQNRVGREAFKKNPIRPIPTGTSASKPHLTFLCQADKASKMLLYKHWLIVALVCTMSMAEDLPSSHGPVLNQGNRSASSVQDLDATLGKRKCACDSLLSPLFYYQFLPAFIRCGGNYVCVMIRLDWLRVEDGNWSFDARVINGKLRKINPKW